MYPNRRALGMCPLALLILVGCDRNDRCVTKRPPMTPKLTALMRDYDKALSATKANAATWARPGIYPAIVTGLCNGGQARFISFRDNAGGGKTVYVGSGETFYYDARSGRFLAYVHVPEVTYPENPCKRGYYYPKRVKFRHPVDADTEVLYP